MNIPHETLIQIQQASAPEDIGDILEKVNEKTYIISSIIPEFDRAIVFMQEKKIKKINFVSDESTLSIKDILNLFGNFEVGYNFRDDFTRFFIKSDATTSSISVKVDGNASVESDNVLIKKTNGDTNHYSTDSKIFKSLLFELK